MVTGEYSQVEWDVRQLTNSDPWGCAPAEMQALVGRLCTEQDRHDALKAIRARMMEGQSWQNRYKALSLLDHILKLAPMRFVELVCSLDEVEDWKRMLGELKGDYRHVDEKGKDQGVNVRVKAGKLRELLCDPPALEAARKEAQDTRDLMSKRRQEYPAATAAPQRAPQDNGEPLVHTGTDGGCVGGGDGADDNIDDAFDDFQSADSGSLPPPAAAKANDPFGDLLAL